MTGSKQIIKFLQDTYKSGEGFTSTMIAEALPDLSKGSITGLLAKLLELNYLERCGMKDRSIVYAITSGADLSTYGARSSGNYTGGTAGRTIPSSSTSASTAKAKAPKKQKLMETLFNVI